MAARPARRHRHRGQHLPSVGGVHSKPIWEGKAGSDASETTETDVPSWGGGRPGGGQALHTGISVKPSSPLQAGRSGGLQVLFTASCLFKEGQQGVNPALATRGVLGPSLGRSGW